MPLKVTISDIEQARKTLQPVIHQTPVEFSHTASQLLGNKCYFKLENMQLTGSFKIRGAYNKIASLTEEQKKRGVVASSAGNHAQGVARSAQLQGVQATIIMPQGASIMKAQATQGYGAQVIFHGDSVDEAIQFAQSLIEKEGKLFIHPFADEKIIAGQGTVGLECLETVPSMDTVVVPIGGGGLISGVATAIKALKPKCRVIGVVSELTPGMMLLKQNRPLTHLSHPRIPSIADGIAVKKPSMEVYESFIAPLVDEIVAVSDEEIAEAIVFVMERLKMVTEGSGAAAFAAALHGKVSLGEHNMFILSGGNIDLNLMAKIIQKSQIRHGRLAEIGVSVSDLPGSLSQLTRLIAQSGANILDVRHDRLSPSLGLRETRIYITMETRNVAHTQEIVEQLKANHFFVLEGR